MIGLDTNLIVRYIVQDDPEQSAVATRIFESELSTSNKGHVCLVVLCEVVWVLARAYKQPVSGLTHVIRALLLAECIEIERRDAVWKALRDFEAGTADFSDYLIAHVNQACGSSTTLTFDRAAATDRSVFRFAK